MQEVWPQLAEYHNGKQLGRATPTILNTAYLPLLMWDGRKNTLEDQALGPVESADEMHRNDCSH